MPFPHEAESMSILGRVFRRMAFRAMRGVYRRLGFIAVGAVLVAGFLVVSTLNLLPTDLLPSASSGGGNAYVGSSDGEPESTVNFIRGQQIYDARLVWDAYSDRMRRAFQQEGTNVEQLQQRLESARQRGSKIEQAQYIGSYP